ncbi:putative enzyme related to lactoylglutathione lyase [Hasllibacter halocynthiae]|uniref:Putative enzyme related to lactoylglutathione lyase n=1 Tax=Hasllibacter halocynthiae TaxID=595589 RepID=A0A2T0X1K5_9RHOB|nr:VOC family protein [Hasllibacter halocynthiae]PRY92775.1 putative enzyme related to lactoylglutathione lyase [Hasllibacter halocynthiae]
MLEHVNVTVSDPDATAAWLGRVFGWTVRWAGPGMQTGRTVHVGEEGSYVALFGYADTPPEPGATSSYRTRAGLNHIGVTVDDLDAAEERVRAEGFEPGSHADYEPGRRFYFDDRDGVEWEVVSYR